MARKEKFVKTAEKNSEESLPILYSFRRCPYAMRARLALLASGLTYEHREVVLRDKPAVMLAASPKGTVPVMVLSNGQVIDQSLDIMLWALRQNDPYNWLEHEEEALNMITQCDGDFKFHLDRYKYPNRYEGADALVHRAKAAEFAAAINAKINAEMTENCYTLNSCLGNEYKGLMPFLRQFSHVDKAWFVAQNWSPLQAALTSFETSTAFKTVMQSYVPWKSGDAPILVNVKK
jgi:glutathione S-transferase